MSKEYHILSKKNSSELAKLLAENGQVLLPMVELIEESRMAVDELIETLGRATVEAVLRISAASLLTAAEKNFRRIMGYRDLWMLEVTLREGIDNSEKAA